MVEVRLASLNETALIAGKVATILHPGDTVSLIGGLGAGKTTFTRALVHALGGGDDVTSPTYVLEHEYPIPDKYTVRHWDLYRLGGVPLELLEPPTKSEIRLIEWADKFPELLEVSDLVLRFSTVDSVSRSLRIEGVRGASLEG